ncbi:MAG: choice-of-anchor tandem repeat GloVer-containing protein [Candidatus Binataceae bacterium]
MRRKHPVTKTLFLTLAIIIAACGGSSSTPTSPVGVASTVPAAGATAIRLSPPITVKFNQPMDPASINSASFSIANATGIVSYEGRTASFTPTTNLLPNTSYTATVTTAVAGKSGVHLSMDVTWSFTTGPTASINVLSAFNGTNGSDPWGSLTLISTSGTPALFGRTKYGGPEWDSSDQQHHPGGGVIFKLPLASSPALSEYAFTTAARGPSSGYQPHHDAMLPVGNLLYGTTLNTSDGSSFTTDGNVGTGVIFTIDPSSMAYSAVYNFRGTALNGPDGANSHSCFSLSTDGSLLYGATALGGQNGEGTVYSFDLATMHETVLHSFDVSTGSEQHGRPEPIDVNGNDLLIGMTRLGGMNDNGVLYAYDTTPGAAAPYTPLHYFQGAPSDGATPDHGNVLIYSTAPNSHSGPLVATIYGLTTAGGSSGEGTLFRGVVTLSNPPVASTAILHNFGAGAVIDLVTEAQVPDVSQPHGSLILLNGWFYGMGAGGGANGGGGIFRISPDPSCQTAGCYGLIASFDTDAANVSCDINNPTPSTCDLTGSVPIDNVIASEDGSMLYGMTSTGGPSDPGNSQMDTPFGTVFSIFATP